MAGRKQTAAMELAIGATIIAGIILLIVMLMAWGNSTSFLGRHYRVVVNMANVGGLKEGAPVKLGGFQIGRVASIQIRSGGTDMEIVLDIDEDRLLPKGSTAKVSTAGLVGDAFMEIIPGKSSETIKRAATVAEAERLESSPLPDMSEILTRFTQLGDQLTILIANINDVAGDYEFRTNVKSLAANMDDVALQTSQILSRGKLVIDNIEIATQNLASLSGTIKDRIDEVTGDVRNITGKVSAIADRADQTLAEVSEKITAVSDKAVAISDKVSGAVDNLDGGITEIRAGVNKTINNEELTNNLAGTMQNVKKLSDAFASRNDDISQLLSDLKTLSTDLTKVSGWARETTGNIEPSLVASIFASLTGAINSLTEVVEKIKSEPVLALSVNKAADRIVKMKFDEMARQPNFKTSDAVLQEINRWIRENMDRGRMFDPSYRYQDRPYVLD